MGLFSGAGDLGQWRVEVTRRRWPQRWMFVKIPMPATASNPSQLRLHCMVQATNRIWASAPLPAWKPRCSPHIWKLEPPYEPGHRLELGDAPCWLQRHHRRVRKCWTLSCVPLSTSLIDDNRATDESPTSRSNAYSRISGLPGQEAHRPAHFRRRRLQ